MYKKYYHDKESQRKKKKKKIQQVCGWVTIWLDKNCPAIVFYKCF